MFQKLSKNASKKFSKIFQTFFKKLYKAKIYSVNFTHTRSIVENLAPIRLCLGGRFALSFPNWSVISAKSMSNPSFFHFFRTQIFRKFWKFSIFQKSFNKFSELLNFLEFFKIFPNFYVFFFIFFYFPKFFSRIVLEILMEQLSLSWTKVNIFCSQKWAKKSSYVFNLVLLSHATNFEGFIANVLVRRTVRSNVIAQFRSGRTVRSLNPKHVL